MSEVIDPVTPEQKNPSNIRKLKAFLALGSVAMGVGVVVSHEVWPVHPDGLTVEISADGSREHFEVYNTVSDPDKVGIDGLGSHKDRLVEGVIDCSYVDKERTAANIGKAVQVRLLTADVSEDKVQFFRSDVLTNACNSGGFPKNRSGWDITQAYVRSGMSDGTYLG